MREYIARLRDGHSREFSSIDILKNVDETLNILKDLSRNVQVNRLKILPQT